MSSLPLVLQQYIHNLQQNAQSNVPVIPNNGNPMGANNMPSMTDARGEDNTSQFHYPWLRPSPSMALVHQLIAGMSTGGNGQVQQQPQPMQTGGNMPAAPVLPAYNTGIVPPTMSTNLPAHIVPTAPTYRQAGAPPVLPTAGTYGRVYQR